MTNKITNPLLTLAGLNYGLVKNELLISQLPGRRRVPFRNSFIRISLRKNGAYFQQQDNPEGIFFVQDQKSKMQSKNLHPDWLDKKLFPFTSRTLEIDGNIIHFIDEGKGPALLLLHGNPTWSFLYRHIVLKLSPSFRCIALDYPGFGLSTAKPGYSFTPREHSDIVEKLVEKLGLVNLRIMVQDWGGPIGLGFAGRRPELIHSLIIGNTFAWPADRSKGMTLFSKIFGSRLARFFIRHYNTLAKWLIPAGTNRKLTTKELAAYMGPFPIPDSRLPTWIFPKEIVGSKEYLTEVEAGLSKLKEKPALIVWGEADGAFRKPDRLRFIEFFPKHRVRLLPKAKHFIQENAPDEICAAILESANQKADPNEAFFNH